MTPQPHTPWTDITLVIDRSGSIASIRHSLLVGINQFLADQAKESGRTCISLVRFDDQFETVWDRIPVAEALPLQSQDLVPRGNTALYDAIGITLERTQEHLAGLNPAHRPARVIVAVFTDGHENASRRFTHARLQELIRRRRQESDWQILFLAASMEVIQEARSLGIDPSLSIQYEASESGTADALQTLSHSVSTLRHHPTPPTAAPSAATSPAKERRRRSRSTRANPAVEPGGEGEESPAQPGQQTMPGTARW